MEGRDEVLRAELRARLSELARQAESPSTEFAHLADALEEIAAGIRSRGAAGTVTAEIRAVAAASRLGWPPTVSVDGPADGLERNLVDDLLAVLEEALANVARHAYASSVEVAVDVRDDEVILCVRDDGVGPNDEPTSGRGLLEMAERAVRRGGTFEISANKPLGTAVCWAAPIAG